ncbi:MAG: M23 family metallopeptidase, partial [Bacillota bacterium]|nr:M23 family metallopeptidase [Bacillota bacterium]
MSFDWLRKRLKEQIEDGSNTMPDAAPAITPAVNIPAPKTDTTVSTPKIDPKTGANGAKVFSDITAKRPMLGENSINDLIDAYNAGYNGTDINEEIKENAHAGDYTSEIEAVINAGLQDAKDSVEAAAKAPSVENSKAAIPSVNIPENNVPKDLDNLENLSYTPSTTLGDIGTDKNADDSKSSNWSKYGTRNWDQDYNYIEDMMFLNGAESSSDPEVQKAYQYLANYENRDKKIPDEIMETFKTFMENVSSGKNNADMKIQMALQYVKDPKNQGKISPDTVKAVMNKTPDLDIQTLRDDQIKRSQGIALGDADVNYFDYNDLKNRNDFNPFHSPTDHYPNIKQSFGEYYSKKGGKHLADDIGYAGQKDPPVYSIYDGEVVVAQDNGNADGKGGNGLTVIIRHVINGKVFYSGYMHLKNYSVKVGDPVYGGEQIGIMGKTGGWINDDGKNGMDVHLHLTVFTCDDEDKFSHSPLGYSSNGKSYKGANNGVLYTFYDPQELIDTRGK